MAENSLQTIRDYASSLQGDERQSFIDKFNSIKDDDSKVNTLVSRIGKISTPNSSPNTSSNNNTNSALLGASALAGTAALGYAANKTVIQPWQTMKNANAGLRTIGNNYGINPQTSPDFVPQALTDKLQATRTDNQAQLRNISNDVSTQLKNSSSQLKSLDANDITKSSSNLANTIKSHIPNVYKGTIDNYGKALDAIDELTKNSGFQLSNKNFTSNFLDKVIEDGQKSGINPQEIKSLIDTRDAILGQSKLLDAKGKPVESNMNLSDAKSVVGNLTRENPYSPLSAKIREGWANFLEKEAPASVKPMYEALNKQYKPFAEARTFLNKLSNPATGEFDSAGLSKYIEKYVKKGGDTGINNLMSLLGEGSSLVPKVEHLSSQFKDISGLKDSRALLVKTLQDIQSSSSTKINAQQQINLKKVSDLLNSRSQASVLKNVAQTASDKLPLNMIGKGIGKMIGLGGKLAVGIPMGAVQGEMMNHAVGYDPSEAFQKWMEIKSLNPNNPAQARKIDTLIEDLKSRYQEAQST